MEYIYCVLFFNQEFSFFLLNKTYKSSTRFCIPEISFKAIMIALKELVILHTMMKIVFPISSSIDLRARTENVKLSKKKKKDVDLSKKTIFNDIKDDEN